MSTLGERLRLARERKNLKQTQVMERTGINNKTLSGYENGVSEPDLQTLKILADFYEVDIDWLLGGEPKKSKNMQKSDYRDYDFIIQTIKENYPGVDITDPVVRKKLIKAIDLVLDDYEQKSGRKQ